MNTTLDHKASLPSYGVLMVISCGISFGCYVATNMRLPVVPLFASSLGLDTGQIGIINSAFFLMAGFLSLPLGMVSDRVGRKFLATSGVLILAGATFLLFFSKTFWQLTCVHLLIGVGLAAFGPTMMSFVADISPPTHLGRSYGWYTTSLYSGMSLGPAAGGLIAEQWGYLQVFLFSGGLILVIFVAILQAMPRSELFQPTAVQRGQNISVFRQLVKNRPLMGCWLITLGACFGLGMFITFIPLHAHNQGLTVSQIGLVFFVQGLVNALSRIPLGYLSDKVADRKWLVVIGMLGFAAAMAGLGLSRNAAQFMAAATGLGICMGLAFTSIGALIAETVTPEMRGLAMGGYNTCIYAGMMISSALMGTVIQNIGFDNGFYITGLINIAAVGLFGWLMKGFAPPRSIRQA